jgi:hypothetical protein
MHLYRSLYNEDTHHTAYDNAMRSQPKLASEPLKTPSTVLKTVLTPIYPHNSEKEL